MTAIRALMHVRSLFVVALIVAAGCDPIDVVTLHVPAVAGDVVTLHWVRVGTGPAYVDGPAFVGRATGPEVAATRHTCCGTAAAYRSGDLWFLACEDRTGGAPLLTCGKVGAPPASFVRSALSARTCRSLALSRADIDLGACHVVVVRGAYPS